MEIVCTFKTMITKLNFGIIANARFFAGYIDLVLSFKKLNGMLFQIFLQKRILFPQQV